MLTGTTLEHAYTLHARATERQAAMTTTAYDDAIKVVATFKTIEEFWGMYQHIKRPSQLTPGTQLNLFIDGIKPMWEVDEHKNGGVWNLRVNKGYSNKLWEDLILGLIGE